MGGSILSSHLIFSYLRKVIQRRVISFFLLCLLLLINWHNTFSHSHQEIVGEELAVVHEHGHHHSDHHHGQTELAHWDWLNGILGDFEHPDLGENHFELFLNPGNQIGLDQPSVFVFQPFILTPQYLQLADLSTDQRNKIPIRGHSFFEPSFFDSLSYRGPPAFS